MDKIPFELHRLRGFPGKRRHSPEMRAELPPEPPNPPDFLSAAAKSEWTRLAPELHRLGLLTVLDLGPLAALCEVHGNWATAVAAEAIETDPDVKAVLQSLAADYSRTMLRLSKAFGLTPLSRTRLRGTSPGGPEPFGGLIG
jgi:P27 family predicted phage terminase small subunit